jgi:putative endonuclease
MSGQTSYYAGLAAEDQVARHYTRLGQRIAAQRWRGQGGEIDLVTEDDTGALVFVEVKKSRSFARAAERLTRRQMNRLCAAAAEYLGLCPRGQLTDVRFDVALVNATGDLRIVENAFGH